MLSTQLFKTGTAIVYCEANFGSVDGKTANGLVRRSERYEIKGVLDSEKTGQDSGIVLDGKSNGIPIYQDLDDALSKIRPRPDYFIFGTAPASGNIVNGLHEFLSEDSQFVDACKNTNVQLIDVRKPRTKKFLRLYSGRVTNIDCVRIAILGTDCAIGKRTTANILSDALNEAGIKTVMVGTGQTGLIQGAKYGVALDAVPSQYCAGELEATILEAYDNENPDVIVIEGQGALSHPAFSTSSFILRGSAPQGVIVQHAPARVHRCDFEKLPIPHPTTEINLIQTFASTKVIGLTINHENMTELELEEAIERFELDLNIPVTDALMRPSSNLVNMVTNAFPQLAKIK
jgi:uncharacterized NAD-dependent epimerase/dehydratase family protein